MGIGWQGLGAAIAQANADLIGISVYTPYVPKVSRAVRVVREAAPQALIVLGGPHVTFTAEETLQSMPQVDVVARGEGDQILVELAQAVDGGHTLEQVPGIVFRHNGQMAHALMPTQHMTHKQVWIYAGWACASFYLHPIRLIRGVFARNPLKRQGYRQMVGYVGKQFARSFVPRIR